MFYEGTEKRLEISIRDHDLLKFPEKFWTTMVAQAGAFILSKIENDQVVAYLLSESSLFVWKNRLLLLTCGNTHLLNAAQYFLKEIPKEKIQSLLFHRHQAIQPNLQESNFTQDTIGLNTLLQGITQHWRGKYQGDLFFFDDNKVQLGNKQILMCHGLSGRFAELLQSGEACTKQIASTLAVNDFFPELLIDQFTFSPKGYSLNAIAGNDYLTIHITPEKLSAYLSLETSLNNQKTEAFTNHLLTLFQPLQSNLMCLNKVAESGLQVKLSDPHANSQRTAEVN